MVRKKTFYQRIDMVLVLAEPTEDPSSVCIWWNECEGREVLRKVKLYRNRVYGLVPFEMLSGLGLNEFFKVRTS